MKVSRAGYYLWASGKSYLESSRGAGAAARVKEVFWFHGRKYGSRRIAEELKAEGIGRFRVRHLMRELGLRAIQPARFKPKTTTPDNALASPNLLKLEENQPKSPGEVLVGDITYLPLANGKWCYLAMFQDRVSKRIAGWTVSDRMTDDLVTTALKKAIDKGCVRRAAIIHTDRGSQYSSNNFRGLLKEHRLRQSMSGKGNCYDNAQAESFFARFKAELVEGGVFESVEQARSEARRYIDGYYNRIRRHSAIGYLSPEDFERNLEKRPAIEGLWTNRSTSVSAFQSAY